MNEPALRHIASITTMSTPEVPGEISDHIISHVWPDIPSLLNCALVCSRWLPASRHHLFIELSSPSRKSYDLLVSRVLHSESMRPCLASVRSVQFIEYRIGAKWWEPLPPEEKIGQLFLCDFIGHLPNLRSLRFQAEDWIRCPPHTDAFAGFSQFPSLSRLELFDCKFPSFTALREILSGLPALSSLMINDVYWPASPDTHSLSPVDPTSRPKLETLYFVMEDVNHCAREFMQWLVQTASRSSIRQLEVFRGSDPSTDPWSVLSAYTHLFASSVDYLRIIYTDKKLSSLSDFTALAHLSIEILDNMHGRPDWEGIVRLLQSLQCRLSTLEISFSYTSPPHFAHSYTPGTGIRSSNYEDGMEVLDAAFERKRFQDMKRVTFALRLVLADEDVSLASRLAHSQEGLDQIIQRKLPKLSRRIDVKGSVHVRVMPAQTSAY